MTDYKDIIGLDVEAKSDNPTNVITGEIWFNTTTGKLRYKKPDGAAAWSTGGDLNVGRKSHGGAGTQTAALVFGGEPETELYNGSSWTELNDINEVAIFAAGCGSSTAALFFAGSPNGAATTAKTELWNGSSWTEVKI